jgi:hypothetical protein
MLTNLNSLEFFFELEPLSREDVDELKIVGFFNKCAPWGVGIFLNVLFYLGGVLMSFSSSNFFCMCFSVWGGGC